MSAIKALTLQDLEQAVAGHAAAFRCVTEYQPAGGVGDKVFPPTHEKGEYAVEKRVSDGGQTVDCVLLDSVQSQANRMELALLDARRAGRIELPLVTVAFDDERLRRKFTVTSLEAPHRLADALLRDSLFEGVIFRKSVKGRILDRAEVGNATGLFGLCPTALVFGIWDSTGPRGGLGAKFQRALVSEMVGFGVQEGVKTSSRNDPAQIMKNAAILYERQGKSDDLPEWTIDERLASPGKNGPKKFRKEGKPSEANHCNVPPTIENGGFTLSHAKQITVLSLATLRRLRFPLDGCPDSNSDMDRCARTVLAALGLMAATLVREQGADLRSRCLLVPTEAFVWELLDQPGEAEHARFSLSGDQAIRLYGDALNKSKAAGLPWEDEVKLTPVEDLIKLVSRSEQLAPHQAAEGDE